MPGPYTGLDPALLVPPTQPDPAMNPAPNPMDVVGAAIAALQASGGTGSPFANANPSMLGGGAQDTQLEVPGGEPMGRLPSVAQVQGPDVPVQWGDLSPAMRQSGVIDTPPVHTAPATVQNHAVRPASEIYPQPSAPVDPVAQAMADEEAAYARVAESARAQKSAEVLAEEDKATRLAAVYEQGAKDTAEADAFYQVARQRAHADADAETAAWFQQYTELAKQEPNPTRWWDNQSSLGKAMWGLSMVFSAANVALTPGAQNVALNLIMDNVARDVQEQQARLQREMGVMKLKGEQMKSKHARNLTDAADDHTMKLGRLQTLRQAYIARASAPGATGMQAGLAAANAWFDQQVMQLAASRREQAVQLRENQLNRSQAAYLAAKQRDLTWNMQTRDIGKDYDLAALAASAKTQGAQGEAEKDYREIPLYMGGKLVGSPRGEVPVVHKEQHEKISDVFANGNKRHRALSVVNEALEDGSFTSRMLRADPELNAAAQELAYTAVKTLQGAGVVSDADVKNGMKSQFGIDLNGNVIDAIRFEAAMPQIKGMVRRNLADLPLQVSNEASKYLDAKVVGKDAKIVWRPTPLHRSEGPTPNISEALGGSVKPPPTDLADFERKRAMEAADPMFRSRFLPSYDKEAVRTFAGSTSGLGPDEIRKLAEQALNDYADPWSGKPVHGDPTTTRLALESEVAKAIKTAEAGVKELEQTAKSKARGLYFSGKGEPTLKDVSEWAKRGDIPLTDAPDAVQKALDVAKIEYQRIKKDVPIPTWERFKGK